MTYSLRIATRDDIPILQSLIAESARALGSTDYTPAQIEAALGTAWGVDTTLVDDETYFVAIADDEIIACGGWSYRKTLFGADAYDGRLQDKLDPERDAARIRAFFVRPAWARKGIGRALLERCESEAAARGFTRTALVATLPGRRLYEAFGYIAGDPFQHPLGPDLTIQFVPMQKELTPPK